MKIINKKARHDYEIIDTYEAGILLTGSEVKSLKMQNASMNGCFIKIYGQNVVLQNLYIGTYQPAGKNNHIPERNRSLLLKKKEIIRLIQSTEEKGKTIIPLEMYLRGKFIKVLIATARGKKKHDKRLDQKTATMKREAEQKLKQFSSR